MTPILELHDVSMVFPAANAGGSVTALDHINFQFQPEEFVVALDASGCGKTTLLNLLAGFLTPTSGHITLQNKPIAGPVDAVFDDMCLVRQLCQCTRHDVHASSVPASLGQCNPDRDLFLRFEAEICGVLMPLGDGLAVFVFDEKGAGKNKDIRTQ